MDKTAAIKEIKSKLPLSSIVKSTVELRGHSPNFLGLCPFHQEKTPSFHVRDQVGRFKCFGCGASGDIFEFLMRLRGISFLEALNELIEKAGIRMASASAGHIKKNTPQRANDLWQAQYAAQEYFTSQIAEPQMGLKARQYLIKDRGLLDKMIHQAGIGFSPSSKELFFAHLKKRGVSEKTALDAGLVKQTRFSLEPTFINRITFPIRNFDGRIVAFGARTLPHQDDDAPKYVNTHSYSLYEKRKSFYGLYESKSAILKGITPLLVEGYFDAMAAWALGMPALALCGTALSADHTAILRRLSSRLIICFDADEAGRTALYKSLLELYKNNISPSVVILDKKDPGAYLADNKLAEFKDIVSSPLDALCYLIDQAAILAHGNVLERVRQMDALLPIFASIKRPLVRRQYVLHMANSLYEDPALLWREIEQKIKKDNKSKSGFENSPPYLAITPNERLLLEIVISMPILIVDMKEALSSVTADMAEIIKYIAEILNAHPLSQSISKIAEQVNAINEARWPAIKEVLQHPIGLNQDEAKQSLADLKAMLVKQRLRESLKAKRLELQDFEKRGDFSSVLSSLKEKSELLLSNKSKAKRNVSERIHPQPAIEHKKINDLKDESTFFDSGEDWY